MQRLTDEFMDLPADRPAAAGEAAVPTAPAALIDTGMLQETNFDHSR